MVLTHDYWTRFFGAAPDVIETAARVYAFSSPAVTRVIGVLEPGTHYTGTRTQKGVAIRVVDDPAVGLPTDGRVSHLRDVLIVLFSACLRHVDASDGDR